MHINSQKKTNNRTLLFRAALVSMLLFPPALIAQNVSSPGARTPSQVVNEDGEYVELSPFTVSQERDVGYSSQQTMVGSRIARDIIDVPSNIAIMNKQLIEDLNAFDVQQALNVGVSGVTQNQTINDDFNIRGFRTSNSLRNNISKTTFKRNPMYDVERIEVLKGPAALLLGNNSFLGGAVNFISIRPTATPSGHVRATVNSDSQVRVEGNVSGPVWSSDDLSANYRLTAGRNMGSRDKEISGDEDEIFLGAGTEVFFGQRTSVRVNGYYFKDDTYRYWDDFLDVSGAVPTAGSLREARINPLSPEDFSPGRSKDAFWNNSEIFIDATLLSKLTENLNLRGFYSFSKLIDRRRHVRGITVAADNFTLNRQDIPLEIDSVTHSIQVDLQHSYKSAYFELDSTVGVDRSGNRNRQDQSVNSSIPALDTRTGLYPADDAYFSVARPGAGLPHSSRRTSDSMLTSLYVNENLALFDQRLILVGGIRTFAPNGWDDNGTAVTRKSEKKFDVSKVGIVYKILPWLSAYATKANNVFVAPGGFTDRFQANDQLGDRFRDQKGELTEYGIKMDHRLSDDLTMHGSLVHFDMALTNVRTFGDLGNGVEGIIQSAEDKTNGWELDYGLRYRLGEGNLDVIATYFNGDSETATDARLQAVGFAKKKISLLAKYGWTEGSLKGLMIGGSIMDQSAVRNGSWLINNPAVVNLFAGYKWRENWEFQLNLDNVTDKRYIVASAATGLVQVAEDFQARLGVTYRW